MVICLPLLLVYAIIHRQGRRLEHKNKMVVVHKLYDVPFDYSDLKSELLVAARHIYFEYDQLTTDVTIERHLKKRYLRTTGSGASYHRARKHYKRQVEFTARIIYMRHQNEVKVKNAYFVTPEFYENCKDGYDFLERGKRWNQWEMPPLIPPDFEASLHNPDTWFNEPLTLKLPSYAPYRHGNGYAGRHLKGASYAGHLHGAGYAGRRYSLAEKDRLEEDNNP
jgi:hypothetical protein